MDRTGVKFSAPTPEIRGYALRPGINQNRVAVVIPAYNSERFLRAAVESALSQTEAPAEVIVVDDGSTDGTPAIIDSLRSTIRVVRHVSNRGLPAARNSGIKASTCELIGFLDADDVWEPEMVRWQKQEFSNANIGLCYTTLIDCDEDMKPIRAPRSFRRRHAENVFDELYMTAFPMPPSTVFVRRDAISSVGYFDESMLRKQDFECWLRMAMLYPISCIPEPMCRRRVHSASLTFTSLESHIYYEQRAFDLCGEAAQRWGVGLPMSVDRRKVLSLRRRCRETLRYGDHSISHAYRAALEKEDGLTIGDVWALAAIGLEGRVRGWLRRGYYRLRSRASGRSACF